MALNALPDEARFSIVGLIVFFSRLLYPINLHTTVQDHLTTLLYVESSTHPKCPHSAFCYFMVKLAVYDCGVSTDLFPPKCLLTLVAEVGMEVTTMGINPLHLAVPPQNT